MISEEKTKIDIQNNIFNNIKTIEIDLKKEDMNISFFSSKNVLYFMETYDSFVNIIEISPYEIIYKLFVEYNNLYVNFPNFKTYILKVLSNIEEKFELDLDYNFEIPEQFKNKLKESFKKIYKISYNMLSEEDEDEIIQKLVNLNQKLKLGDFPKTKYKHFILNSPL